MTAEGAGNCAILASGMDIILKLVDVYLDS